MLNENAKKWVAALRSGNFRQGRGALRDAEGGFCCLGVAVEIAKANGVKCKGAPDPNYLRGQYQSVREWLGLRDHQGSYFINDFYTTLAEKNDNGCSFSQIADIIESEPMRLFTDVPA